MFKVARSRESSEELTNHEQEDPPKDEDVFPSINTFVINTSITSSSRLNVVALNEDNKKLVKNYDVSTSM
jgi:hypothetical protein